jgi:hypothetical protein
MLANALYVCCHIGEKAIPLQSWTGPEGSRRLRLPDFKTVHKGGKVVSPMHLYPQEIFLILVSVNLLAPKI